jgi:lipoate-protein ligase A
MLRLDYSSPDPAINLALDEVLLDRVEQGQLPASLRFWESPVPFVVLGTGQRLATEVREEQCLADSVPIMRRCTAGGCVLQGPGSLNYALFLPLAEFPDLASLHGSYRFILDRICLALETLGIEAARAGISDIAIAGRKVSGNAQRRRRNAILQHGTLLYAPDMEAIDRYLHEPEERPDYRGARVHRDFVTSLPAAPDAMRCAIAGAFGCSGPASVPDAECLAAANRLAREKYNLREWIHRR